MFLIEEANRLAEKTNTSIQDNRSKHYSTLAQASPKELWAAVKTTNGTVTQGQYPSDIFHDVNNFFRSCLLRSDLLWLPMLHVLSDTTSTTITMLYSSKITRSND